MYRLGAPRPADHDTESKHDMQDDIARDRRLAALEAILMALACMATVSAGVAGVLTSAEAGIRDNYQHYLSGLALAAAQQVDAGLHASIHDARQIDGPEYVAAVTPLRRFRDAIPDVRFVYTVVRDGADVRFVLDAAEPGDLDGDGVEDRSGVWELYEDADAAMHVALGRHGVAGVPQSTDQPYSDRWGTFMSGYAPFFDASGREAGVVGVDVEADVYVARLASARRQALLGLLPAIGLILALSFAFYRIRLRGLVSNRAVIVAGQEAQLAAGVLAQERQRLRNVIDGTGAGTWDWNIVTGEVVINDRWASMIGYGLDELGPVTVDVWKSLLHPDDFGPTVQNLEATLARKASAYEFDFRMHHRDGHWVWISARGNVIERAADGTPLRMAGTHQDITARKEVDAALKDSERRFRGLFELSPVGIALSDYRTGQFLEANDALLAPTGYTREEFLTLSSREIATNPYVMQEHPLFELPAGKHRYGPYETEHRRKDGTRYPVLVSGLRMSDGQGRELVWSIVQDISGRKEMESELKAAAQRDKLTGLANRSLFMEGLQRAIERVRRHPEESFAVLFLDFDHFKRLNDTLGHAAGDELLTQIAWRLRGALRASDTLGEHADGNLVARFGGDEFVILLNDIRQGADVARVSERLLATLAPAYSIDGREVHSTASIGIVTSDQCTESAEAVIRNADVAMYEAKRSGRGCSVIFNEGMHTRLTRQVAIESGLRKALAAGQMFVMYQPIVDLRTGRMISAEALLRWEHPQLGLVSPAEFIPIAEESGVIVPIGDWVLQEACRQLVEWQRDPLGRAPETVSVNISRVQLGLGAKLLDRIRGILAATGLRPECLQLEVTEREVMRDPRATRTLLRDLREVGVRLAMDDFGTGTSSLACLREYPFDVIKIDRAFVGDLADSRNVLAVIHATIALVDNLGMSSVAEGVEEASQAAILESLGCHYAQGYFFSPPVTADLVLGVRSPTDDRRRAAG
jgi:diguanylate cyclase (GGDEF)-like protein/PAS domain S-box-containing protein